jgi:hypothetical protein
MMGFLLGLLGTAVVFITFLGTIPAPKSTLMKRIVIGRYPKYVWPLVSGPIPYNTDCWLPADIAATASYVTESVGKGPSIGHKRVYTFTHNQKVVEIMNDCREPYRLGSEITECTLPGLPRRFSYRIELTPTAAGTKVEWFIEWTTNNPYKRLKESGVRSRIPDIMEKSLGHLKGTVEHAVEQPTIPPAPPATWA